MRKHWKQRALLAGGAVLAALSLLVLAMPLWFPWLLGSLAPRFGLEYGRYERIGYSAFTLRDVRYATSTAALRAREVTGLVPTAWLWRKWFETGKGAYLTVEDWELRVRPQEPDPRKPDTSVYSVMESLEETLALVRQWLPRAALNQGAIHAAEQEVRIPHALWERGILHARLELPAYQHAVAVKADVSGERPYRVAIDSESLKLQSITELTRSPDEVRAETSAEWLANPFQVTASFDRGSRLPEKARVQADGFTVPAELLKLRGYEDLQGSLSFLWRDQQFSLSLAARASPATNEAFPRVTVNVRATGNTNSATIETAEVKAPGVDVALTDRTRVLFARPFLQNDTKLSVALDLAQQPWTEARGLLKGAVVMSPGREYPNATFAFSGAELGAAAIELQSFQLAGEFQFPWLHLTGATVKFEDGSIASADAAIHVQDQVLQDGQLLFDGPYGRQWLPKEFSYESANLSVRFDGPLTNVTHAGEFQLAGISGPSLQPLQLDAAWNGQQLRLDELSLRAEAGNSALTAAGSLNLSAPVRSLELTALTLWKNAAPGLELQQSARVELRPGSGDTNGWAIHMQPFHWAGADREVQLGAEVVWPQRGRLEAALRGITPALFDDFHTIEIPHADVHNLELTAAWTNSPIHFRMLFAGEAVVTNGLPLLAEAALIGDDRGVTVEKLSVSSGTQPIIVGEGSLPLVVEPGSAKGMVSFRENEPLRLQLATQPHQTFWNDWAQWGGVRLQEPVIQAGLDGTWAAPRGQIRAQVQTIHLPPRAQELPPLEEVRLLASITREAVVLEDLRMLVMEQPMNLEGQLPLPKEFWTDRKLDFSQAQGRLQIQSAQIAAAAAYFPEVLSPQGRLSADVTLQAGSGLEGELRIHNAGTRPLPSLGSVRDVDAEIHFKGRRIELASLGASLGGQPIEISGAAMLPEGLWTAGDLPAFEFRVRGKNLPLARRPEAIVRADLNIAITNSPAEPPPVITGEVILQNSYYTADLGALIPGKVARPSQRPPYFSIEREPFDQWRLNVRVRGNDFLRVRSPVFRGEISTTLQINGTLAEPAALGEVRIGSGTVRFPFANFQVTEGFVSLTSENPYEPQLFVTASAERVGYELRMEVTGSASEPKLEFSSSPPLSPEQILLMVTAGQSPTQAGRLTGGQRAQRLGVFVGRNLLSQLGLGAGNEDRLSLQTGNDVTETGRSTYEVEYKLSDRWSVVGEYDRFNDVNVGLKWNIFSR